MIKLYNIHPERNRKLFNIHYVLATSFTNNKSQQYGFEINTESKLTRFSYCFLLFVLIVAIFK